MLPRLVGYAWPAFWLAAPLMWGALPADRRGRLILVCLHAGAGLLVPLLAAARPLDVPFLAVVALVGLVLNRRAGPPKSTDPR